MAKLFGGGPSIKPQPVAPNPADDAEARKQRENEARQTQLDALAGGRKSTVFAGQQIAEEQAGAETLGSGRKAAKKMARSALGY